MSVESDAPTPRRGDGPSETAQYIDAVSLPTAILIVALTLVVGSAIYLVVGRRSPVGGRSDRTPTNVYLVTGGAMSLLIAFTMSITFSQYSSSQAAVQQEADAVMSMSRAATFMQPPARDELRDQLVCYAQEVIDVEWPSMRRGDSAVAPEVIRTLDTIDSILVQNPQAVSAGTGLWESANSQRLAAHEGRLLVASDGVPPLVWFLLILGSMITIGSLFVYADRSKPDWGHVLVIVGPLFIASAALVVIAFFDHPYANTPGAITPKPMQTILTVLTTDQIGDIPLPSCPPRPLTS